LECRLQAGFFLQQSFLTVHRVRHSNRSNYLPTALRILARWCQLCRSAWSSITN
jgi:hypothetical protein